MVASRPCTQEKNTIGPQRVIRLVDGAFAARFAET